jgi:thymidylate synthase (FAD)
MIKATHSQKASNAAIAATYIDHMGGDLSVVNAARVSFGKVSQLETVDWVNGREVKGLSDRDAKLIHYLAKHKHMSPFGHAFASFHVKAPIFVARQLVKHKFLRFNEVSRRYVTSEPEFYVPQVWRGRSKDKKQGSEGVVESFNTREIGGWNADSIRYYQFLINDGVAPEQARMVLPQSTMTEWYWSGSLDAFADMCRLRCKDDTQYETRLVADQISVIMKDLFPVSWDALTKDNDK